MWLEAPGLSLRANTYIALTGAVFIAIAMVFAATLYAGRAMVHGVERNLATTKMQQVARQIGGELRSLDTVAHDWGSWDDAVRFVGGQRSGFEQVDTLPATMGQLDCDALLVVDLHGNRLLEQYSPKLRHDLPAQEALRASLGRSGALLARPGNNRSGKTGILPSGGGTILVAARPIVASSEKGPIYGTIVFGRLLDTTTLKRIGAQTGLALRAYAPTDPSIPSGAREQLLASTDVNPVAISVVRPLDITAYLRVDSLDHRPAVVVGAGIVPMDYDLAMRTLAVLIGVFLAGGVIWAVAASWVVDSTSLSRLTWLRDSMSEIAEGGALSGRIAPVPGVRDEVSAVALEINAMLDALGRSHERVRESEELHRVLVENIADAVLTLGLDGMFTFANPQAALLTGIPRDKLVGLPYETVLARESVKVVSERLESLPLSRGRAVPVVFVDTNGRTFPVELSISPVRDAHGNPVATTWIARDVTERREFEDRLVYLASHDHLTGLFNRRRFEEEVSQRLAESRRRRMGGALIWLDLDNFKDVNDNFGHKVGDALLAQMGSALRDHSREEQVLARLGGDEFAMLLPGAEQREAVQAAERVLRELSSIPVNVENSHPVRVTASAGVALYPSHASSVDELLLLADTAMYNAKENGRNRVCLYSPDEAWPERIVIRREWAERIETALENQSFEAFAQPILDLSSGEVTAYELLVRMIGGDGSLVLPDEFLSIAEDLGLIADIDRLMVRLAVALVGTPEVRESGVKLFVNLSAKTIADPTFLSFVSTQLEDPMVDPERLGFELTETALVANMARARDLISRLRDMGCGFALDDFGTGFSSITYLRHMPVDVLKIDGGLVREMVTSEQDRHLVRAIAELSKCLGIRVTAEFVESAEILELVRSAGVDYAQGYHLGRPMPAVEVFGGARGEEGSRE